MFQAETAETRKELQVMTGERDREIDVRKKVEMERDLEMKTRTEAEQTWQRMVEAEATRVRKTVGKNQVRILCGN